MVRTGKSLGVAFRPSAPHSWCGVDAGAPTLIILEEERDMLTTRFAAAIRRSVLALLAAATAVAGTALAADDKIVVGALRFTSHSASFIAFEKGYFKEAGLDVEFKYFQAAAPMATAIASGDIDYGITAITGGLINLADKGAIKVIGGALHEEEGIDGSAIVVSDAAWNDGVTSPAKLAGRSFGITQTGSSFHYMASRIAEKEGIPMSDLRLRPLQKVGAIIVALKSGQIDVWAIVPHIAKALAGGGVVHIIGWVADYAPDYQVTTVFTSAKTAAERRDRTRRFLAAFARGAADFNAALVDRTASEEAAEATVRLIHKYVYTSRPYEKAAPSIRNGVMRLNEGAKLNVSSVEAQLDWFKAEGLVKEDIGIDKLVDGSYVETY